MLPKLRAFSNFPELVDEFFGKDLLSDYDFQTGISMPSVNVIESNDEFKLEVAAPGLTKEDFNIDLHNNVLTISSEKEIKNETNDEKILRREFSYSSFKRSFTLPTSVDAEKINATHNDGILNIVIPKKEEAKEKPARRIAIE